MLRTIRKLSKGGFEAQFDWLQVIKRFPVQQAYIKISQTPVAFPLLHREALDLLAELKQATEIMQEWDANPESIKEMGWQEE